MIDPTNIVASLPAPAQVQSTLNAWNVVALGAGAFVSHAYHLIVQAGGIKRIAINFWNSEPAQPVNRPPTGVGIVQPTSPEKHD